MPNKTTQSSPQKISLSASRQAFALNVTNGALFGLAETLMNTNLVLVLFLSRLTDSNLLLGLLGPIATAGWFLPQLFVSGWVQSKPKKLPIYRIATVVRILTWGMLVLTMWLVRNPVVLLAVFYPIYATMRVAAGLGGIPFLEIMAKTVPLRWRGRLFALRFFFAGLVSVAGSRVVRAVLDSSLPYPNNYALLVFIALIAGSGAMLAFAMTQEPAGATRPATSLRQQLRRGLASVRRDADYRNVLLGRSFTLLGTTVLPFYTVLAKRTLGAPEQVAGDYLSVLTLTQLVVNYPWGWLADTRGLRWVARVSSLGWMVTSLLALALLVGVGSGVVGAGAFPLYALAYPLFVLVGIFYSGDGVAGLNLLLQIAPEDDRPLYLGFGNTWLGVVALLGGLSGGLVDLFGMGVVFVLAIACCLLGFGFLGRVRPFQESEQL